MTDSPASQAEAMAQLWKPYPEYKDCGIEWLGDIPAQWRVRPLKRAFDVQLGKMLQPAPASAEDTSEPYLRAANIHWEGVDLSDVREMWFAPYEKERYSLQQGDLLISEGGDVGRSALWEGELENCFIQNAINRVRSKGPHSTRYLYYWMYALKQNGYIDVFCNKATIAHFTAEKVERVPVPLLPVEEERAIVDFLDEETAKIDTLIAKKEQLIELLPEKRAGLISHAVTKGLDPGAPMKDSGVEWLADIPAHWEAMRLKFAVVQTPDAIKTGPFGSQLLVSDMAGGDVKVYTQANVVNHDVDEGDSYISRDKYEELRAFRVYPGDILVTTRGTIGRCVVVPNRAELGILHPCLMRVQPNPERLLREFLALLIEDSSLLQTQLLLMSNATTIDVIYSNTMREVTIPVPPLDDQHQIVEYLREETSKIDTLIARVAGATEMLREYRTALISAAVTGKIDVREALP